jgi:hypothetical protein
VKHLLMTGAACLALAAPAAFAPVAFAQDAPVSTAPPAAPDMADMPGMDMSHGMAGMDMSHGMTTAHGGMDMSKMASAIGPYPMTRDASGTSWQPDASRHDGVELTTAGWNVMAHALFNGVYDSQSGPRGGDKAFVSGMVMVQGSHTLGPDNTLQLKGMFSPDPFMGPSGYPLLLATGETADGKTPLVDRQHPHDLLMELSAALSHKVDAADNVFLYAGLPGEPALGPPAFMHRMSAMDSPEAPITHHWLDSTHITFGVVTAGWVHGPFKIEVSSFKGREPDQRRFDIETPKLDSESVRVSWNPDANWSLQTSWGHLTSPEQLEPTVNEDRVTASAIYTRPIGADGWWATTAAFGSKRESYGQTLNGWLLESALHPTDPWTLFARAETEQNNELLADDAPAPVTPGPTPAYVVSKLSLGAIHDWRAARHVKVGLGALYAFDFVPEALKTAYGDDPHGAMLFMRLKID